MIDDSRPIYISLCYGIINDSTLRALDIFITIILTSKIERQYIILYD